MDRVRARKGLSPTGADNQTQFKGQEHVPKRVTASPLGEGQGYYVNVNRRLFSSRYSYVLSCYQMTGIGFIQQFVGENVL